MVKQSVGFDGAKHTKGRKRHTVVDTLGLVLRVVVTAASVPEREGGKRVLKAVHQMGEAVSRLYLIWADGGYIGHPFLKWAFDLFRCVIMTVLRPQQTKGFVLPKKRWVVERTFGWLNWSRRLSTCPEADRQQSIEKRATNGDPFFFRAIKYCASL